MATVRHSVQAYVFTVNPDVRYLLLRRRRRRGGFWQPVTGRVEPFDETFGSAAVREVVEETGITQHRCLIDLNYAYRFTHGEREYFEHAFGLEVIAGPVQLSKEHEDFRWVAYEEALGMLRWRSNKRVLQMLDRRVRNVKHGYGRIDDGGNVKGGVVKP